MDTVQLVEQTAGGTLSDLIAEMQRSGVEVQYLQVTEVKPGLHERAEGISIRLIYVLSWYKEPIRLFGGWSVPGTDRVSKKFIKLPLARVNIPGEARERYETINNIAEIEESAVFLSTELRNSHLTLILAVRIMNQWLKLHHWSASWTELGISRPEVCHV